MCSVPDIQTWVLFRVSSVCADAACEQDLLWHNHGLAVVMCAHRSCAICSLDAVLAFDEAFAFVDCAAACTVRLPFL
jgi:hypothetical protein